MDSIKLAGCIIQNDKGHVLLLHRNTPKRTHWEIPGGKIEADEDAAAAAARELLEELGVVVAIDRILGERQFTQDDKQFHYTWLGATITGGTPTVLEPETHDQVDFFGLPALSARRHELSPNAANFIDELLAGRIQL